jgi:hypothetical protein
MLPIVRRHGSLIAAADRHTEPQEVLRCKSHVFPNHPILSHADTWNPKPTDGWYRETTINKIKAVMKAKIMAISEGKVLPDSECVSILEQESEDEEQEAARKAKEAQEKGFRSEKRRTGTRNIRHSLMPTKRKTRSSNKKGATQPDTDETEIEAAAGEEQNQDEEEANGEWEEELELPSSQGQVDGRVHQMMAEYMNQGDIGKCHTTHS